MDIENARRFNFEGQRLWLLSEKAIFWQKKKTLMVADIHIGKSGHFRKNGIAVPDQVNQSNLDTLSHLVEKTKSEHVIILGDLFHSDYNKEWEQFINWRKTLSQLEVSLVIGNHDILNRQNYHQGIINVFKKLKMGPFLMVHDIKELDELPIEHYPLSGHIHPAVKLKGRGRQSIKLPCFYFGKEYGVLPAFGAFTGTHIIAPRNNDRVFIIAENEVIPSRKLAN